MWQKFKTITTTLPLKDGVSPGKLFQQLQELGPTEADNARRETILREACDRYGEILDLLRESTPIGKVGDYNGVHRATPVFAGFTPQAGAKPAQGEIGRSESVMMIQFMTWTAGSVSQEKLNAFTSKLRGLHPYERPVIEVVDTKQWIDNSPKKPKLDIPRAGGGGAAGGPSAP